jgi:hypothetical protein
VSAVSALCGITKVWGCSAKGVSFSGCLIAKIAVCCNEAHSLLERLQAVWLLPSGIGKCLEGRVFVSRPYHIWNTTRCTPICHRPSMHQP